MYNRFLRLNLQKGDSAFLWGARKTGKSTYLSMMYPHSARFDLLDNALQLKYLKEPFKLRWDILELDKSFLEQPIIIDEVQKVPAIMDEIHLMIETYKLDFILCGSSTRKMRMPGVNLLGGRALKYHFYPLVYPEIKDKFDIIKIFQNGLIPKHYAAQNSKAMLQGYVEDYLTYEVQSEAYIRDVAKFARFFDAVAFSHGEMINYSNIARDVGINSVTVKEHYQILVDMLIGYLVEPFNKKIGRDIISAVPKFYFFDVGLANYLMKNTINAAQGIEAGRSYIKLTRSDYKISYWRTKTGIEVDFILHFKNGITIPIEVKISQNIHKTELKGLKSFMSEHQIKQGYIVCMESNAQKVILDDGEIKIYPVQTFLDYLWAGKIFQ
jgi:predicted AAA+ superfamily ATPase